MKHTGYNKESGNVLFLILIAVALFAALSYAVTQSTRSGSGSTDREQSLIGSAVLTQYPTALRTSIVRMVLGGTAANQLLFEAPSAFGSISSNRLVFHPDGGGASFQDGPVDVMAGTAPGTWAHNMQLNVRNIGRDTGANSNDLIAFLPGVSESACLRINQQMGIGTSGAGVCDAFNNGVPTVNLTNTNITTNMVTGYTVPGTPAQALACTSGTAFTGRASGCFWDSDIVSGGGYVFYSVIMER